MSFAIEVLSARINCRRQEIVREKAVLETELKEVRSRLEIFDMNTAIDLYQESADGLECP